MENRAPVKRALVSAAVEIMRQEISDIAPVHKYDEIIPTCKKCQQERIRGREYKQTKKGKKKQNRANTPIVIQLKDTLKAAIQQKQRSKRNLFQKQESNDLKDDGDTETDNSSDRSEPVISNSQRKKTSNNFSAFINEMRKPDKKDYPLQYNIHKKNGVTNPFSEKLVAEYVLNNVTDAQVQSKSCHKKNIVECDNVEVICNDLTSIESTHEDTESEISSTTSSSEIQSDSDISNPQENYGGHEFTSFELQQLAAYTTGCPLVRYDCSPENCPQCQWYTQMNEHKPAHKTSSSQDKPQSGRKTKSRKFAHRNQKVPLRKNTVTVELDNISYTESDNELDVSEVTDSHSETSVDTDTSVCDSQSPVSKGKSFLWADKQSPKSHRKQLLDIDITGKRCKSQVSVKNGQADHYLDSVFIDLTDTDVTFTVYYHHSYMETLCPNGYASRYTSTGAHTGTHHHHDFVPYPPLPYSYQHYMYWSSLYNPLYSLPLPFCLEPKESLPKTAMIPPEDLHKCKSVQNFLI